MRAEIPPIGAEASPGSGRTAAQGPAGGNAGARGGRGSPNGPREKGAGAARHARRSSASRAREQRRKTGDLKIDPPKPAATPKQLPIAFRHVINEGSPGLNGGFAEVGPRSLA